MRKNVILIMSDSLRRDHVGAYAAPAPWWAVQGGAGTGEESLSCAV